MKKVIANTPKTIPVAAPVSKDVDTYHITRIVLDYDVNSDATVATVVLKEGYMEGTVFVATATREVRCKPAEITAKLVGKVMKQDPLIDVVYEAFWAYLQEQGDAPAGTVS
jgi:hypothetical protein